MAGLFSATHNYNLDPRSWWRKDSEQNAELKNKWRHLLVHSVIMKMRERLKRNARMLTWFEATQLGFFLAKQEGALKGKRRRRCVEVLNFEITSDNYVGD